MYRSRLLNLLFPNCCPGCGCILTEYELVCEACTEQMVLPHDVFCHRCGKAACMCSAKELTYDRAVVCCVYADKTIRAVLQMKESRNTNLALYSAQLLAVRVREGFEYGHLDCVMPVPMHPAKERERGYNQAALIGRALAKELDLPYRDDVLCKNKRTTAQHLMKNAAAREANTTGFGIREDAMLDGMRILLADDVLTTGSTMNRCAQLLKSRGAAWVVAAAAATTIPKHMMEQYEALRRNHPILSKEEPT